MFMDDSLPLAYKFVFELILVLEVLVEQELDIGALHQFDHDLNGGVDLLDRLVDEDALCVVHLVQALGSLDLRVVHLLGEDHCLVSLVDVRPHKVLRNQRRALYEPHFREPVD